MRAAITTAAVTFLVVAAALLTASVVNAQAPARTITSCHMLFGPLNDLGYTFAHNLGRMDAHKRLAQRFPNTEIRSVSQPGAFFMNHSEVLQGFIDRGCDVIHATAPAFTDSVRPFVLRYPNVTFSVQNGFFQLPYAPNVIPYASRSYKPWYVAGRVAAREARARIGFLTAFPDVPELVSVINAFVEGVAAENPSLLPVHVLSSLSWFSPPKEAVAVRALHDLVGCDVIAQYTDSFVAAEYANELTDGTYSIQMHGRATRYYGDSVLTCVYSDWSSVYEEIDTDRILGRTPRRNYILSDEVAKLCDVSSRAASSTLRYAEAFNISAAPVFVGWNDSQIRGNTVLDSRTTVHAAMPDPDQLCPLGTTLQYATNTSTGLVAPQCVPCAAGTFGAADRLSCQLCPAGLKSEAGAGECYVPPSESLNTGAVGGGIVAAVVVLAALFAGLLAVQSRRMSAAVRDTKHAPRTSPCTIVFTDIEHSTMLWSNAPEAMGDALDTHNGIMRAAIRDLELYEVKTAGDSFMIACPDAVSAAKFSQRVQTDMFAVAWSAELPCPVRVRIGFSHGDLDVVFDEHSKGFDYFGTTVNLAARCEAAADGGQVFFPNTQLSHEAAAAIGASLSDPFERELRGFDEPVRLVELLIPDVTAAYRKSRPQLYLESGTHSSSQSQHSSVGGDSRHRGSIHAAVPANGTAHDAERMQEILRHPLVQTGALTTTQYMALCHVVAGVLQQTLRPVRPDERRGVVKVLSKALDVRDPATDLAGVCDAIGSRALALGRYKVLLRSIDVLHRELAGSSGGGIASASAAGSSVPPSPAPLQPASNTTSPKGAAGPGPAHPFAIGNGEGETLK